MVFIIEYRQRANPPGSAFPLSALSSFSLLTSVDHFSFIRTHSNRDAIFKSFLFFFFPPLTWESLSILKELLLNMEKREKISLECVIFFLSFPLRCRKSPSCSLTFQGTSSTQGTTRCWRWYCLLCPCLSCLQPFFSLGKKKSVSGSLWTLESDLSLKAGSAPLVSLGTYLNVSEAWFPSKLGAPGLPSISGEGKGCNSAPCGVDRSPAWLQLTAAVPDALAWDGFWGLAQWWQEGGPGSLSDMDILVHVPLMCCPWWPLR